MPDPLAPPVFVRGWVSAHLHCASPFEPTLRRVVSPLVATLRAEGLVDEFFFVRYWERGPHLRLRFHVPTGVDAALLGSRVLDSLEQSMRARPTKRTEPPWVAQLSADQQWLANNQVRLVNYEAELKRYGGPAGLELSERHFDASSQMALAALEEADSSEDWTYEQSLSAAIKAHIAWLRGAGMSRRSTRRFLRWYACRWIYTLFGGLRPGGEQPSPPQLDQVRNAIAKSVDQQRAQVRPVVDALWRTLAPGSTECGVEWLTRFRDQTSTVTAVLDEQAELGRLEFPNVPTPPGSQDPDSSMWVLFDSYMHMTNNRLGVRNRDEAYLAHLLDVVLGGCEDDVA